VALNPNHIPNADKSISTLLSRGNIPAKNQPTKNQREQT